MRRHIALTLLLAACCAAQAQRAMRIWQGGDHTRAALSDITYSDGGEAFTVGGKTYRTSLVDSITMVHVITVTYAGETATMDAGNTPGVTCSAQGARVAITSENTVHELEIVLQGATPDGSLTYTGGYKCRLVLNGLDLTSQSGPALDIKCGKRVALALNPGTSNRLADAAGGTHKAALYCKGHLEVEGAGSLTVEGRTGHAIATKEYLQLKRSAGDITIAAAANDAIHAGQYFLMNGGTVTIGAGTAGDGIQVEPVTLDDGLTPDPSKEDNGLVTINGGTIDATITGQDRKALRNEARDIAINGGTLRLRATGNGSRGIQTDGNLTIGEAEGATSVTVSAEGGLCQDPLDADDPHRCMGMKIAGNLTVTGGVTTVTNPGKKSRGVKLGGIYTKTGGTFTGAISY